MIRRAQSQDIEAIIDLVMIVLHDMELDLFQKLSDEEIKEMMILAAAYPNYRYHPSRCFVYEDNGDIVGVAVGYRGDEEDILDDAFNNILIDKGYPQEWRLLGVDSEAYDDEWYLDTIAIDEHYRGQGIGKSLLKVMIEEAIVHQGLPIGLNVDLNNDKAKKLYEKIGFKPVGICRIGSHTYDHMQKFDVD